MPEIKTPSSIKILRPEIEKAWRKWMDMEVPDFPETFFEEDRPMRKILRLISELIWLLPGFGWHVIRSYWRAIVRVLGTAAALIAVAYGSNLALTIILGFLAVKSLVLNGKIDKLHNQIKFFRANNRRLTVQVRDFESIFKKMGKIK